LASSEEADTCTVTVGGMGVAVGVGVAVGTLVAARIGFLSAGPPPKDE